MAVKCPKCQTDNPLDSKFCKECATPLPFTGDLSITKTLETPKEKLSRGMTFAGRYEIIEELGKGGMGTVYRAEDTKIKQEIALKLIRPEIASDKRTIGRFSNEIKTARMVSHRNVCRMFDLGEEGGTHFITMEYVPGEDLKSLIRRVKRLDAGTAMDIAVQVCEGLAEAHRLGVVHRDLKSSNIMIDRDGNVRIMDFGIARSVSSKGLTGEGIIIGTPEYMSPEQADAKDVDHRSDLYSLGVILYEMATGSLPFEGETPLGTVLKHKSEYPPAPKKLNPQIPDDLNLLILKCLAKDRQERSQTAEALKGELERIAQTMPTAEREIPKRRPLTSKEITITLGVKKLLFPAVAVLATAVIAIFLWRPWAKEKAAPVLSDRPSLAILRFTNNTGDEALDNWRDGLLDLLVTDIGQSKHLYVVGSEQIYGVLERFGLYDKEKYSSDDLKKVAAEVGVAHVLTGSYIKAGDQFIINAALQNPHTSEVIERFIADGIGASSIPESIDKITLLVKSALKLSDEQIATDNDKKITDVTTSSPEALQFYNKAVGFRARGEFKKSLEMLEQAVDLDPNFAMAYRLMWLDYSALGYPESGAALRKAVELSERLPLSERLYIQAQRTWIPWTERISTFERILKDYPEHEGALGLLGLLYRLVENYDKAIERLDLAIRVNKRKSMYYIYLAAVYRAKGLYDKAEEILATAIDNCDDDMGIHMSLSLTYACQGKYDLAFSELKKESDLFENKEMFLLYEGNLHLLGCDFSRAEKVYLEMVKSESPRPRFQGRYMLGNLYISKGDYEKAKKELDEALKEGEDVENNLWISNSKILRAYADIEAGYVKRGLEYLNDYWRSRGSGAENSALYFMWDIIFSLKNDNLEEAGEALEGYKEARKKASNVRATERSTLYLQGAIELKKENYSEAITLLEEAVSLLPFQHHLGFEVSGVYMIRETDPHCMYMSLLASAYCKKGDLDRARDVYEKITDLTTGRLWDGDKYAKAFYMLGKIYEQRGWPGKAIEHYQKFLEVWKDADPGLPEVEDAKAKLASLKN